MAQLHKLHVETQIKSSADKFYTRFKNNMTALTKVCPEIYKSIQVVEGDGKSVGSIILWKFTLGDGVVLTTKEKIVAVDNLNRSITFEVVKGEPILNLFKSFVLRIKVGRVVKWSLEFEKTSEQVQDPIALIELLAKVTVKLDGYLLKE